jgi:rhombotail lipoprotein
MKHLRPLVIGVLICSVASCAAVRDPAVEKSTIAEERVCSAAPMDVLNDDQRAAAGTGRRALEYPLRIGLFFLSSNENSQPKVPTLSQQEAALRAIREMLVAKPYVDEVVIVPTSFVSPATSGATRIQQLAQRFDFDVVALLTCSQFTREFRNLRPMGWITYAGDWIWQGDVDQAETFLSLTVLDPVSLATLTFANGQADWGDTTSGLDDWRSPDYARRGSFDRALDNLLSNFIGASYVLEPAFQRIR